MKPYSIFLQRSVTYFLNKPRILKMTGYNVHNNERPTFSLKVGYKHIKL